jgi:Fe-S-cluster-containing hydrogenase component 2
VASREKELSALPQTSDPPRGRMPEVVERLIYPFQHGEPPEPRQATGFFTDTTVCIGCKACEVACKQWNQLPSDGFNWSGNSYDNTMELSASTWRRVKFIEQFSDGSSGNEPPLNRWLMMSDHCEHCLAAPCHQACPTGAIIHNEFENVYIQADICNSCSAASRPAHSASSPAAKWAVIRTNARFATTTSTTVLNRPAPKHVRPSPSTSAQSTSCASRPVNEWRNFTGGESRRRTFTAMLRVRPIPR